MSEDINIGQISEALNDKLDIDLGNTTTTTKETVVGWGMPDYSAGVDISFPYTCPTDGVVVFQTQGSKYGSITIDAQVLVQSAGGEFNSYDQIIVCKGSQLTSGGTVTKATFYPLKGVNNA